MRSNLKLTKGMTVGMIVGGDLLLLVFGWFLLVGPQRATAQSNALAAGAAEAQVIEAKRPVVEPPANLQPKQPEIRTAYLYKLSKAMPMTMDMPNLLLELSQVVRSSGVKLSSISPSTIDPTSGAMPITLSVTGDFYTLTDLLYRLRSLVTVRDGSLDVSGRLFSVQSVGLTPSSDGSGLQASISMNTYSFGAASAAAAAATAAAAAAVPPPTDTSTTSSESASSSADTAIGH